MRKPEMKTRFEDLELDVYLQSSRGGFRVSGSARAGARTPRTMHRFEKKTRQH